MGKIDPWSQPDYWKRAAYLSGCLGRPDRLRALLSHPLRMVSVDDLRAEFAEGAAYRKTNDN